MADNVIELVIKTIDEASAQIRAVGDSVDELAEHLPKVSAGALGISAAFAAATFAAKGIIDEISKSQFAAAQLDAAFKATGQSVGITRAQLDQITQSLTKTTTASSATVKTAESILLTFDKIGGDIFPQVIQAAADLAARLGEGLPQAMELLGRALQEPETGLLNLRRAGVTFSAEQVKVIRSLAETGDAAKADAIILDEIERRFGGSAAAAAGTLGGALQQLKNSFADLFDLPADQTGGLVASIDHLKDTITSPDFQAGISSVAKFVTDLASVSATALSNIGQLWAQTGSQADRNKDIQGQLGIVQREFQVAVNAIHEMDREGMDRSSAAYQNAMDHAAQLQHRIAELTDQFQSGMDKVYGTTTTQASGPAQNNLLPEVTIRALSEDRQAVYDLDMTLVKLKQTMFEFRNNSDWFDGYNKAIDEALANTQTAEEKAAAESSKFVDQIFLLVDNGEIDSGEAGKRLLESFAPKDADFKRWQEETGRNIGKYTENLFPAKQISDQSKIALDGIQHSFDHLFEAIPKGWHQMASVFAESIEQMVSKLLSSQLMQLLFGSTSTGAGGTSQITGGLFGGLFSFLGGGGGSGFTLDPSVLDIGSVALPGFAAGTSSAPGGLALVGEHGPEIVNLPGGSQVLPYGSFGGGAAHYSPVNNIVISAADADRTKAELIAYLDHQQKQGFNEFSRTMQRNGMPRLR